MPRMFGYLRDQLLDARFEVFKPQSLNPHNKDHRELERFVFQACIGAMTKSDLGLFLAPYGKDCSWEVGWYSCSNKTIIGYFDNSLEWLIKNFLNNERVKSS